MTQSWALAIYEQGKWAGVRWWSYYDPAWYSYAVWDLTVLALDPEVVQPLSSDDSTVLEAAEVLGRPRQR